jgi:hypothetical protein
MAVTVAARAEAELAVTLPLSTVLDVAATVLAAATGAVVLAGAAVLTCATTLINETSTCLDACAVLPLLPASVATACCAALRASRLAAVLDVALGDAGAAETVTAAGACVPWSALEAEAGLVTGWSVVPATCAEAVAEEVADVVASCVLATSVALALVLVAETMAAPFAAELPGVAATSAVTG